MGDTRTQIWWTETTARARAAGANGAWATFEQLSGGAPRAGMLRLGRAAGLPWTFAGFGTRTAEPSAPAAQAGPAPEGPATVVLRVRTLARAPRADAEAAGGAAPVTLVGATN